MNKVNRRNSWWLWGDGALYLVLCGLFFAPIAVPYKLAYPLVLLTLVSLVKGRPLLTVALALSALGDFCGASGELLLQIGAFSVAQVCYLLLIACGLPRRSARQIVLAALLPVALSLVAAVAILPAVEMGAVKVGVVLYALLIGAMTTLALLSQRWSVRMGAMLFMLSDFTLAYAIFVTPAPPLLHSSLALYFVAQWLLWLGLRHR